MQYMSDGSIREQKYQVERPRVGAEYQKNMGVIDGHNYHRQGGMGAQSLESVAVRSSTSLRTLHAPGMASGGRGV